MAVLCEYVALWEALEEVQLQPLVLDMFVWRWSPDGAYSASSAYRAYFISMSSLLGARELWKASAPPKVKFFFWLTLHEHLWTADQRRRHGLQVSAECALCDQGDETIDHLFIACVFARELWFRVLSAIGWGHLAPTSEDSLKNCTGG